MKLTTFADARDNRGKPAEREWRDLPSLLRAQSYPRAWSPATFSGTRAKSNVRAVEALVLDIDGKAPGARTSMARAIETLAARDLRGIVHTTKSHRPGAESFRVVVALSRPATADEHAELWLWGRMLLLEAGQAPDHNARDESRLWYGLGGDPESLESLDGEPLDVDATVAIMRRRHDAIAMLRAWRDGCEPTDDDRELPSVAERKRRAEAYLARMPPSVAGQHGHDRAFDAARTVVRGFALDAGDALDVLRTWNSRCEPPWSAGELRHKVADAAKSHAALGYLLGAGAPANDHAGGHGLILIPANEIFAPLPPPNDLVEGVLRRGTVALLGAYGGSGKTWLATDLGLAVGGAGRWLGAFDCKRGRATFLDYESGAYELRRRIQALAAPRALGAGELSIDLAAFPDLYVQRADFAERIQALAADRDLIVVDSLAAISAGIDENSSDMRRGLDVMRAAAERTSCVFVVVLHAKKTGKDGGEIDARELFRGSSAIYDAADAAFAMTKCDERWKLSQTKARHGRQIEPLVVQIVDEGPGVVVRSLPWSDDEGAPVDRAAQLLRAVARFVREHPNCSRNEIELGVRGATGAKRSAIEVLVERGDLVTLPGERKSIRYRAAPRDIA